MAYEVTATRRRPGQFKDLIGQEFVVATLQKSIEAGKIAHAYLFSGPRGCGKTSSARILARALNCEKGPSAVPCGQCSACLSIARGSNMDVLEIDGASNTSVNDVRQIKDEVQFPPNSCRYKVYIIDEVHMLSTSAFNALLKTIEEPPPYVVFIFATTELHKVPATIKSRCQQFNFRLVPVELLKEALAQAAAESGITADDDALFWVAREATGSVRDAYTLFDQVSAFSDGHLTFAKIEDKLGLVGIDRINHIMSACAQRNVKEALSLLDEILQAGVSVEQCTVDLADYLRGLLLLKGGVTREALLGQSPDRYPGSVLSSWSIPCVERALSIALQLFRDIRYSVDSRYELELAVSRLAWISDYVSSAELQDAIGRAQALLKGSGGQSVQGKPAAPFVEAGLTEASIEQVQVRQASLPTQSSAEEVGRTDEESLVADPFAQLKARMNGKTLVQSDPVPEQSREPDSVSTEDLPVVQAHTVDIAELRDELVRFFEPTKNMLAVALSQTFDWEDDGQTIGLCVSKVFVHKYLEEEQKTIGDALCRYYTKGRTLAIKLVASAALEEQEDEGIPERVDMVVKMFRGTIVGGA